MGLWDLHCVLFVFRFYAAAKHLWNLFCTWLQHSGCIWTQRGINSHTVSCMCSIIWWQLHPFGPVGAGWTQKPSLWPICEVTGQLSPPAPALTAEPTLPGPRRRKLTDASESICPKNHNDLSESLRPDHLLSLNSPGCKRSELKAL